MNQQAIIETNQNSADNFAGIVNDRQQMVYNTALGIVQNEEDAEDVTQEVFLKVYDGLKLFKKVWEDGGESVAVYSASSSGPTQYSVVTRYKQGLKERAMNFRKPIKERYEAVNGSGSWDKYMDMIRTYVDNSWSELLFYRADLSSK